MTKGFAPRRGTLQSIAEGSLLSGGKPTKSEIFAAQQVLDIVRKMNAGYDDRVRLAKAIGAKGSNQEEPFPDQADLMRDLAIEGCTCWNPDTEIIQVTHTPTSRDFHPFKISSVPRYYLCTTVMFCDEFVRPRAVVTLRCLHEPGQPNEWEICSSIIYTMSIYGDDIDRPLAIFPRQGLAMMVGD